MITTSQLKQMRPWAIQTVRANFKDDYTQPFILTPGQADMFNVVYHKLHPRAQIIASTQYGKSDVVGMAIDYRMYTHREPFAVVSGVKEKAQIIMDRVIQHLFDNPKFYNLLELDSNMSLDRLRRERSRDHVTLRTGGTARTFTAGTTNQKQLDTALTGFGSPNVIEDEASLIPDTYQAMVLRMLGGHSTKETFLCKIGNPFRRNHFLRTWDSPAYLKLMVDYKQALEEGRYSQSFIDEVQQEPFFDVLYECSFPSESELLDGGWRRLVITEDMVIVATLPNIGEKDHPKLGVDVARGGRNQSVFVARWPGANVAQVLEKNNDPDLMNQVKKIKRYRKELGIRDYDIAVDDAGVGGGVTDRLRDDDILVRAVQEGASAGDKTRYANMRAELYWKCGRWIKGGGQLVEDTGWQELTEITYRESPQSKLQIEPKEHMRARGIQSPDTADALSLTFTDTASVVDEDDIEIV